jgi:hypothetical protein
MNCSKVLVASILIFSLGFDIAKSAPPGYEGGTEALFRNDDSAKDREQRERGPYLIASRGCVGGNNDWRSKVYWDLEGNDKKLFFAFNIKNYVGCSGGGLQATVKRDGSTDSTYNFKKTIDSVALGRIASAKAEKLPASAECRRSVSIHVYNPKTLPANKNPGAWTGDIFVNYSSRYAIIRVDGKEVDDPDWPVVIDFTTSVGCSVPEASGVKFRVKRARLGVNDNDGLKVTYVILPSRNLAANETLRVDIGKLCKELVKQKPIGWGNFTSDDFIVNAGFATEAVEDTGPGDNEGSLEFTNLRIDSL